MQLIRADPPISDTAADDMFRSDTIGSDDMMKQINADEAAKIASCLTPEVMRVLKRAASESGRTLEEYASIMLAVHASGDQKLQQMMDNFDEAFGDGEAEGDKII